MSLYDITPLCNLPVEPLVTHVRTYNIICTLYMYLIVELCMCMCVIRYIKLHRTWAVFFLLLASCTDAVRVHFRIDTLVTYTTSYTRKVTKKSLLTYYYVVHTHAGRPIKIKLITVVNINYNG